MLLPLQAPEIWDVLNEEIRQELGYKNENPVRCYPNLYSAVEEITSQLISFLAHKRNFTWIKGFSPTFEAPLSGFLRDGLQIQNVDWKVLSQFTGQEVQWVEALPKDTLFVLAFEDHAVTGQKMNLVEFEKALNAKKIFFIKVSHFSLPKSTEELSPFTVHIGPSGYGSLALTVCGSRFRAPERGIPYHPWVQFDRSQRVVLSEDQKLVQKIENEFPEEKWFSDSDLRRFDRIALIFKDLAGDRVLKRLEAKLKIQLSENQAQTTHNCHWNSIKLFKSWWTPTPSPEQLRGLILISTDIAKRDDFIPVLKDTLKELRQEAQWS